MNQLEYNPEEILKQGELISLRETARLISPPGAVQDWVPGWLSFRSATIFYDRQLE